MKHREGIRCWLKHRALCFAVCFTVIAGLGLRDTSAWGRGQTKDMKSSSEEAARTKDKDVETLEAAGRKLVALLKNGNPQALPKLCWRNGVTVDLDGTTVTPAKLGEMIAKKGWFYCAYFDSACESQRGKKSPQRYSYRDLLLKADSVGMSATVRPRPGHDQKMGIVSLQIVGGPAREQLEKQDYNFIFILDGAAWKITCFECDPETYF